MKKLAVLILSMAFWIPQAGPQVEAATCPVDFTFFGGSRGGGKSDCLLGRQLRGAELYKHHWNGLMLRRKYKEFQEMRRRIDTLISEGLPAERIGGDQQTNYLRFRNGAQSILTAIDRLERVGDHVGQQYCVAENTLIIMADNSSKPIQELVAGDMVMTLEGPKKVLHKMSPRLDICAKAVTPFGSQVHPIQHPILSAFGWQSYASILGDYSITIEDLLQGSLQPPDVNVLARLYMPKQYQFQVLAELSKKHCESYISSIQDFLEKEHHQFSHLDRQQPLELLPQFLDYAAENSFVDGISYALPGCETVSGFLLNYFSHFHLHGEQPLSQTKNASNGIPLQGDAALPFQNEQYKRDALDNIQEYTLGDVSQYEHPHSGKVRKASEESVFLACKISYYGLSKVYDLTVQDANHYISGNTFLVNKNTEISVDECTTFPFFTKMVDKLKGSCRSPYGVPCHMFGTGNPGGPGHNEVKEYFKLGTGGVEPKTIMYHKLEGGFQETRIFIPSFLKDNRILCENDPLYVARLLSIKDPALKKAWIKGDWDVFIGQAFNITREYHIIKPIPIPDYAPIYMTFDWGFGAPFSIGWWWIDADNRAFRFAEWYGWNGTPNEGLRLEDSLIAKEIIRKEKSLGIENREIIRLAGNDCFNKKPDYKGGGQGPSTAEVFREHKVELRPSDAMRTLKIRQFRERLVIPEDAMPMMMIYDTCEQFLRTIPALCVDETNPEDIDTQQEDHIYDEACHICMARPLSLATEEAKKAEHNKRVAAKRAKLDTVSQAAWHEMDEIRKEQEELENEDY